MISDRTLDILAELHLRRMNVSATATRLGISTSEVEAARNYALHHGHEVYLASVDRARRGASRVMRPLADSEVSAIQAALDEDRDESV